MIAEHTIRQTDSFKMRYIRSPACELFYIKSIRTSEISSERHRRGRGCVAAGLPLHTSSELLGSDGPGASEAS